MRKEIICSGFGGQGIMFMGKVFLQAALLENKFVTGIPAYGAEVRGGTAYCMLIVSDKEIASPLVYKPDICIAMNKPSLDKFSGKVKKGGLLIVNKSLNDDKEYKCTGLKVLNLDLTKLAFELGDIRAANMIALGVCIKEDTFLKASSIIDALKGISKKEYFQINKQAFERGLNLK